LIQHHIDRVFRQWEFAPEPVQPEAGDCPADSNSAGNVAAGCVGAIKKTASLFDMTGKQTAVSTAVQADKSAVPPLLFPTFTAVMR
jgi:hypothetical protein